MTTQANTKKTEITLDVLNLPVFPSTDPTARAITSMLAGQRNLNFTMHSGSSLDHAQISRDLTLDELLEILKVKMYNENIDDPVVYSKLFGTRLENSRGLKNRVRMALHRVAKHVRSMNSGSK
ncbi:hypothetical protein [uncultured Celeribacter sp.]|uniref:hypothetical protein n=1 Tax=uncultured Celeribacter sp. TaxID=1303376 RepID=UPI002AA82909|nr:hypothetical protein [uncultured Celeribacter sp.]